MKTIKEIEKEIENSKTENVLRYDNSNKWRPMNCLLCGGDFTRQGIDRHLNQTHGIVRFDWGIREAILEQTKEIIKMIKDLDTKTASGKERLSILFKTELLSKLK